MEEIARSSEIKATTKTFRCVVHINKQCEVFVYAKDEDDAIRQVEDLSVWDLTEGGNCMDDDPVVKKCTQV